MKRRLLIAAGAALALVLAFLAGRFASPTKTVERSVLDERIVAQAVANARAEWQRSIKDRTVTRTVYKDGKPLERTVYVDRETTAGGSSAASASSREQATTHAEASKVTTNARPGWRVSAAAGWDPKALTLKPEVYEGRVERRVLGTVWLGAWGRTDKTAGVSVGIEW